VIHILYISLQRTITYCSRSVCMHIITVQRCTRYCTRN